MNRFFRRPFIVVVLCSACRRPQPVHPVVVLTTAQVTAMGVAHALTDAFHRQTSVPVQVHAVSADEILHAADSRSGAVAIYRDPELDAELLRRHALRLRNVFADEDYVIVGPQRDPAHVTSAKSVLDAFTRIVERNRVFCSPADLPVLLDVEHEIWSGADEEPPAGSRYRRCHGNATEVLAQAGRFDAYTITDRATAEAKLPKQSRVLMRNVPILHSAYVVALLEYSGPTPSSEWFVEWVMSSRGREFVRDLRSANVPKLYLPGER